MFENNFMAVNLKQKQILLKISFLRIWCNNFWFKFPLSNYVEVFFEKSLSTHFRKSIDLYKFTKDNIFLNTWV